MPDIELHADTADGRAPGRLVVPDDAPGPWPLVVLFVDAGGIRPTMIEMAGHLVRAGHAVLLPDPYWRQAPYAPFDMRTVFGDPPERQRLMAMIDAMVTAQWMADTRALIAAIDDPRIVTAPIGAVGYCMGGRAAFIVASQLGDEVAAVSCIHAGGLVGDSDQSPHRNISRLTAAVYLGVADDDRSCTPDHQAALREALDEHRVRYALEVYPGARHGFAVPDFPVYDEAAASRSWSRTLALFAKHLPRG